VTENITRVIAASSAKNQTKDEAQKKGRKRGHRGGRRHRGGKQLKKVEGAVAQVAHMLGDLKV